MPWVSSENLICRPSLAYSCLGSRAMSRGSEAASLTPATGESDLAPKKWFGKSTALPKGYPIVWVNFVRRPDRRFQQIQPDAAGQESREPAACARPTFPHGRRNAARQRARRVRSAGGKDRWTVREALSAAGPLGGSGDARSGVTIDAVNQLNQRLSERGVRFTQIFLRPWANHVNLPTNIKPVCDECDRRASRTAKTCRWGRFGPVIQTDSSASK